MIGSTLAAPGPDVADPMPVQGSDDEVWMVSYMDIMTLLLTLFVPLFEYMQAVAPGSVAAEGVSAACSAWKGVPAGRMQAFSW